MCTSWVRARVGRSSAWSEGGATTIDAPVAGAEPAQQANQSGSSNIEEFFGALIGIPLGLSSIGLGMIAPHEYRCEGLLPYLCLDKGK